MVAPVLKFSISLGSGGSSVGPTTGVDSTGATALRVWTITQANVAPTITDSKSNTWAQDGSSVQLNSTFTAFLFCHKATTNNVGTGHTFSGSGSTAISLWAAGVSPASGGTVSVGAAWNAIADATSPYDSPSVTPASADALLISFGADDGSGSSITFTWANSFTIPTNGQITDQNSFWGGALGTRTVSSLTSYTSEFTSNSSSQTNSVIGLFSFTEAGAGPTINTQPSSVNGLVGTTASFSVAATGSGSLTYQWKINTGSGYSNVSTGSGGTTSTYTTPTIPDATYNGYLYECVVTDSNGSTTSNPATLSILPPTLSVVPLEQTVNLNEFATFTITAASPGGGSLTYQWRRNGSNVGGATSSSYSRQIAWTDLATYYDCVATDANGSVTSTSAYSFIKDRLAKKGDKIDSTWLTTRRKGTALGSGWARLRKWVDFKDSDFKTVGNWNAWIGFGVRGLTVWPLQVYAESSIGSGLMLAYTSSGVALVQRGSSVTQLVQTEGLLV